MSRRRARLHLVDSDVCEPTPPTHTHIFLVYTDYTAPHLMEATTGSLASFCFLPVLFIYKSLPVDDKEKSITGLFLMLCTRCSWKVFKPHDMSFEEI